MALPDLLALGTLVLGQGEAKRIPVEVAIEPVEFGSGRYEPVESVVPADMDVTRTVGGWALRLQFTGAVAGPCMRCLGPAEVIVDVDVREVDQPGGGDELQSPYIDASELDLKSWAHESFVLDFPVHVVCREDCRGLCPVCGQDLNDLPADHAHESGPDARWAKLSELKLEEE